MTENANTVDTAAVPQTNRSGLSVVVVVLLILVLVLGGGLAYLLLSGGDLPFALPGSQGVDQDMFIVSMDNLVLEPADLSDPYRIVSGSHARVDNGQFSNGFGAAYGKPFILNTGRVDGWDLAMERVNPDDFTPEYVRSRVEIYQEASGASVALSEDWFWAYQLEDRRPDAFLDTNCSLGSDCLTYMYKEVKAGQGAVIERYDVAFRYQNVLVWVFIKGQQGEVSEDLVLEYGQMVLNKVQRLGQ